MLVNDLLHGNVDVFVTNLKGEGGVTRNTIILCLYQDDGFAVALAFAHDDVNPLVGRIDTPLTVALHGNLKDSTVFIRSDAICLQCIIDGKYIVIIIVRTGDEAEGH